MNNPAIYPIKLSTDYLLHFSKDETLYFSTYIYDDISDICYHDHSGDFELTLILQGYGYHYINNSVCEVSAGEVFLIDPGSKHSFFPIDKENSTRLQVLNCVFSRGLFKDLKAIFPKINDAFDYLSSMATYQPLRNNNNYLGVEISEYCRPLLIYMEKLYRNDLHNSIESIELTLSTILLEIYRVFPGLEAPQKFTDAPELLEKAMDYIQKNCFDPNFSIAQVYKHLYVSKSHLCDLFRTYTDTTPIRYMNTLRVRKACAIMSEELACTEDLHLRVGYSEYNTFYVNFRKFTGFNLRNYVKALKMCMPNVAAD